MEDTRRKKKETDVCQNCDTFEINDRIEKLILLITGKTKEEPSITTSSQSSDSWLRVATTGQDLISVYYKFLDDVGLGVASISSEAQDTSKLNDKIVFRGTFVNLGYDINFGSLVFNSNLGLLISGSAESTQKRKTNVT